MEEETEIYISLVNRAYYAARDGFAVTLYSMLQERSADFCSNLMNQSLMQEDGQCCSPFVIAARFGQNKVIKMLLDKFSIDIEQEGEVKFDGYTIKGACALWCAAAIGYLSVVKTLVKAGADVNHPTKTNSTPVRAACFDGRLDVVKYLTHHSADINIANSHNNTCLMIAAFKGHLDIVTFLLKSGANPNEKDMTGETALHHAAQHGHIAVVEELLKYGALVLRDSKQMTPILQAAERSRIDIVECLIKNTEMTTIEIIEAYELLGASFANDKDNYCLEKSYMYLHRAMILRYNDPNNVIRKVICDPIPAYENWQESETLERLESIQNSPNALQMESLVIRERILGKYNVDLPHPIIYRGAVFADNARFDRCIDLWLRALMLRQLNKLSVSQDLLRFAQVFSQMVHAGVELKFEQILYVLEGTILELENNKKDIAKPDADLDQLSDNMESNVTATLYILTILTKLITLNEKEYNPSDISKAYRLVYKLCALNVSLKDGQTLLHLAVNAETPVDDFHTNDVCKFPCALTAKLLIKCGADVNAMDNERNTPLHVIVGYEKPISDFITLHSIILNLIEAGAHMDTVNSQGKTPFDVASTGVAEIILRTQTKLSLKCMAAKAVKTYNLQYCGNVPCSLESFIELHGPGLNQG